MSNDLSGPECVSIVIIRFEYQMCQDGDSNVGRKYREQVNALTGS